MGLNKDKQLPSKLVISYWQINSYSISEVDGQPYITVRGSIFKDHASRVDSALPVLSFNYRLEFDFSDLASVSNFTELAYNKLKLHSDLQGCTDVLETE